MMTDRNNLKHGKFNCIDRLSDLPDFIIHHIISYLGKEEAYRTSVLSKTWNQISDLNPILDFSHYDFPTRYLEYIDTRMQKFSKENLIIRTFKLTPRDTDLLLGYKVDEWLEIAVRNQVAEIVLRGPPNYKLPRILFCAKSLRDLDLDNVEIPYFEALDLVSLEFLLLRDVVIEEDMLFHIVSSCPLLKKLVLSFGYAGFKNIVIPSHSKLEYLHIKGEVPVDGGKVILETSSLTTFKYNAVFVNPWPIISNGGLLRNLRHLSVTDIFITGEDLANKLLPELPSLEKLVFIDCQELTNPKISHTQLKQIYFLECYNLHNVVIDAPNLEKFKFDGEMEPPLSITIHNQANCNIHIKISPCYFVNDGFFILKKLLKGLNSCNFLKILLLNHPYESVYDFDFGDGEEEEEEGGGRRSAERGPPCDIGELKLSNCKLSSSSLSTFLDGLFWTCHPRIISLRVDYSDCHKLTFECLLNKLEDMVKCSEHPLKRIQVEETNNGSDYVDVQLRLCW